MSEKHTNSSLEDIFDVCINRLTQGESVETILGDYPDEADSLRPLLEMGDWIRQAQAGRDEIQTAQTSGRTRLEDKLDELDKKPKRTRKTSPWTWIGVAAGFAFTFGFGLILSLTVMAPMIGNVSSSLLTNFNGDTSVASEAPVADDAFRMTATYVVNQATVIAMDSMPTLVPSPSGTPLPTMTAPPMGTPMPMTTSAALPITATRLPDEAVQQTATALAIFFSTREALGGTPTPDPRALGASATGSDFVSTSVFGMTPASLPDTGDTTSAIPTFCPGRSCEGLDFSSTAMMTPTGPPPNFDTLQVQPLSAGEIDDNADWDTYLLYRRNFEAQYGQGGYIALDVRNRAIVTVLDQNNQPVLGASVTFFAQTGNNQLDRIIEQYTHADGRTLFLPSIYTMPNISYYLAIAQKDGYEGQTSWVKSTGGTFTIILNGYTRKEAGQ